MATEQYNTVDEEIDQIANEIAQELEEADKLPSSSTDLLSGPLTNKTAPLAAKKTSKKKKVSSGGDPSEIEVHEEEEEVTEGGGIKNFGDKKAKPFDKDDAKKLKKEEPNMGTKKLAKRAKVEQDDEEEEEEQVDPKKQKKEEENEQVLPETKQEIIRSVFETMKNVDQDQLAGAYAQLMNTLLGESEDSDESEDYADAAAAYERTVITNEDIDISEDLTAIFGEHSDSLSEEFKTQIQTVFEAAVVSKINTELDSLEEAYAAKLTESQTEILSTVTDKVDAYLSYIVEEWVKDNELAIERGIKAEITEEFIGGLKQLFEDHYIDVPEEKVDVVDSLADRVDVLETELNETIEKNVALNSQVKDFQKDEIITDLSSNLTDIEAEKLKSLSEGVGFEDSDQYKESLATIKDGYFQKTTSSVVVDEDNEISEDGIDTEPVSGSMANYVSNISKSVLENQ